MEYSKTLSLECPYCITKCQFKQVSQGHSYCWSDNLHHIAYFCTNCEGTIITKWEAGTRDIDQFEVNPVSYGQQLVNYYPLIGDWKPRVNLSLITNNEIKSDFEESIDCYNNECYNACMMMARRTIQQEMIIKNATDDNLYKQIESTGISPKLKVLLQKIKNFGNFGAHPDFCLFDENGNQIEDKKGFAKLSLEFLDRYFANEYEIDLLVNNAPKSKKELES